MKSGGRKKKGGMSAGWPEDCSVEIFDFTLEQSLPQMLPQLPGSPCVCRCRSGSAVDAGFVSAVPVGSGTLGGCPGHGVPSLLGSAPS